MPTLNKSWTIYLAFTVVMVAGLLATGINLFHYPFYAADEGTYMSQAWSLLKLGQLAPYTYVYDHAPAGWVLIAVWTFLVGGFQAFGFSVNTGRVLVLVLQGLSAYFLFGISRKFFRHRYAGFLSTLVFFISPMAIYYHRRVLLDNIMVFWLLFSLFILLFDRLENKRFWLSGLLFGFAVLTKETAVYFLPVLMLQTYYQPNYSLVYVKSGVSTVLSWLIPTCIIVGLYPLLAYFRGQLLPNDTGISLVQTLSDQLSRGEGSGIGLAGSFLGTAIAEWTSLDPVLLGAGTISTILNLIFGVRNRKYLFISFFSLAMLAYLLRGALVFPFYIIPLIPFLALNIEALFWKIPGRYRSTAGLGLIPVYLAVFVYFSTHILTKENLFTFDQTTPQISAVNYLRQNARPGSNSIIENYAYVDLNDGERLGRHFDYYWKVEYDRQTNQSLYGGDYKKAQYILASPEMYADLKNAQLFKLVSKAVDNSWIDRHFKSNGWSVDIRTVF